MRLADAEDRYFSMTDDSGDPARLPAGNRVTRCRRREEARGQAVYSTVNARGVNLTKLTSRECRAARVRLRNRR